MTQIFMFEGQKIVYNHLTKMAKTTIEEPFLTAGRTLGWEENVPGLGLNLSIIKFILKTKCNLIVYVGTAGKDYWIRYDKLKQFIETHNCDYNVSGKSLKVISWKIFVRFHDAKAEQEIVA